MRPRKRTINTCSTPGQNTTALLCVSLARPIKHTQSCSSCAFRYVVRCVCVIGGLLTCSLRKEICYRPPKRCSKNPNWWCQNSDAALFLFVGNQKQHSNLFFRRQNVRPKTLSSFQSPWKLVGLTAVRFASFTFAIDLFEVPSARSLLICVFLSLFKNFVSVR